MSGDYRRPFAAASSSAEKLIFGFVGCGPRITCRVAMIADARKAATVDSTFGRLFYALPG
jgi:hypothetical protein